MLLLRGLIGGLIQLSLIAAMLLLPAGTWDWPRALAFLGLFGLVQVGAITTLAIRSPQSLESRLSAPRSEKQPLADRILTPILFLFMIGWFVLIPFDVFRLHLLPRPSLAVSVLGALVGVAGYALIWRALLQNEFAAPIVKDQSESGQVLADTGVYGVVRHPFYLGMILFFFGIALWLESVAAALAVVVIIVLFMIRIPIEERTLVETLPGYAEYRKRVPRRLIPFVW